MDFRRGGAHDEPEINLIPMIDVLLVILLFLMVSTTFSQLGQLSVDLPQARAQAERKPDGIQVEVDAGGRVAVNRQVLGDHDAAALSAALSQAAAGNQDAVVTISADGRSPHQAVIDVMSAARQAGLSRLSFATRESR